MALVIALHLSLGGLVRGTAQSSTSTLDDQTAKVEQALKTQDTATAIKQYRVMVAANPSNSQAWTGLGVLLYGSGHSAEAADALKHALQLNPAAPRAELFLSFSQADMRQCAIALPSLQKHFEAEPVGKLQRLTGLYLLGCSMSDQDSLSAIKIALQLKQNYPGDPDVLYETAELYTRMWTETASELMTAHPDSYRVHQLAAEVNEAQGNYDQAIREYKSALGQNPRLPQMHYRIGQLLLRKGDADADQKAMEEFHAELASNPQSATSALAMGEIERHQGNIELARSSYELALKIEPDLPEARVGLAQAMLAQHQVDAAQTELKGLIAQYPDNAQAHYAMMLAYREQRKLPEASAEMVIFKKLQERSAEQFQKKLAALLTGNTQDRNTKSGVGSTP